MGLKEKDLSQAGREILIKSVLQAMLVYIMSIYLLHDSLINFIISAIRNFWWKREREADGMEKFGKNYLDQKKWEAWDSEI